MTRVNAPLTPTGRLRLARCIVDDGWLPVRAAERLGVSRTTARHWSARYCELGKAGMTNRPRRLCHSPRQTSRRLGPAKIAYHLGMHPSTVHKILTRYGRVRLDFTDPATGARVRVSTRKVHRYEHHAHGGPGARGHHETRTEHRRRWAQGPRPAQRQTQEPARDRLLVHHNAVDDYSRLAYSELPADEKKETAAGFWERAAAYYASAGITVRRVLCYRSNAFEDALGEQITHKRTWPYRSQTNGKVERYNRTILNEWANATAYRSEAERMKEFLDFLRRGRIPLRGATPAYRVSNFRSQ